MTEAEREGRTVRAKDVLGRYGEDRAAEYLAEAGYDVLARNWRCGRGELDIVARAADGTLVFCEVKTRSSTVFGLPAEAVGWRKASQVRALATQWLRQEPHEGADVRFDVIAVLHSAATPTSIEHLIGAF